MAESSSPSCSPPFATNRLFVGIAFLVLLLACTRGVDAGTREYLSGGEVAAIGGGSALAYGVGLKVKHFDSTRHIFWDQPSDFERNIQNALGGSYYRGKTNFLDSKFGSALTPGIGMLTVGLADLTWPQGDGHKTFLQDQFLMFSGLIATKAVTDLTKGLFRRTRPVAALEPALMPSDMPFDYAHQSFFSGHASSAFFAMTYANIRVRSIMRSELSAGEYRDWRWLPPTVFFSWASYVGWSRLHAFKHYLSDVAVGAAAGWLMAELFHSFGDKMAEADTGSGQPAHFIRLTFTF